MATRKLRGYSLVMKPDRSGGKTLKIYGVYEDEGGKACIQRVRDVDANFKEQIKNIFGSGVAAENVVPQETDKQIVNNNNLTDNNLPDNHEETEFFMNELKLLDDTNTENSSPNIKNPPEKINETNYNEPMDVSETKNNTTELAIATSVVNNSTTTPATLFRFSPTGGKTQKRLPKSKRSNVFSRRNNL